jgi:hypothetical protein
MAMETCQCGARFAVGLAACPRCSTVSPLFLARSGGRRGSVAHAPAPVVGASFKDLRARAKSLGLSGAGGAQDLAARIAEHEQMAAAGGG